MVPSLGSDENVFTPKAMLFSIGYLGGTLNSKCYVDTLKTAFRNTI